MPNISIVTINKNQENAIPKMVAALKNQLPDIERCFVLDRCTDNSKHIILDLNEKYVENHIGDGFCAATARNIGLQHVNPNNDILFLDGDRIPNNLSIDMVEQALESFDITLLKAEIDNRRTWFSNIFVNNPNFNKYDNEVWTCGFAIRRSAIDKIKYINNGRLFNEIFNDNWGYEDVNLGDMALCLGLTCGGFPSFIYLNGEVGANVDASKSKEEKKQQNIRKLIRTALFIKFNKPVDNETWTEDRPYAIKTSMRNYRGESIYIGG